MSSNAPCPCRSGLNYGSCCEPYHSEQCYPPNALALMRSRYSAYATSKVKYIIDTSHPTNVIFTKPKKQRERDILRFCQTAKFVGLEIVSFVDGAQVAYVTFIAYLIQEGQPGSLQEKSRFVKENGRWLYVTQEAYN